MSMIDAMVRVDQIKATLVQLTRVPAAPDTAAAAPAPVDAFAASLATALGSTGAARASAVAGTPVPTGAATGIDVAEAAKKYLGVPYVFGGEDASGMDCSGLVQRVYADLGIEVPRLVSGQMKLGTEVNSLAEAKPGDLIVTAGGDHILIYAGDNKVIHAPYPGRTVSLVDAYMTDADITTIRRVIPEAPPAAAVALPRAGGTDIFGAALAAFATGGSR